MDIEEKARELAGILLDSEIYNRYLAARETLSQNNELFMQVNEYRTRNFYIQNSENSNKIDEIRKLLEEYDYLMNNRIVREYLDSELILCRTIKRINSILVDKIDIDTSFII